MAAAFGKRQSQMMTPLIEMIAASVPWHMDRMKVRRGVKYVITKWYRERPWA